MKKILCITLSIVLILLSFAGCGKVKDDANKSSKNKLGFRTETFHVPMKDIYIDLPSYPYEWAYSETAMVTRIDCEQFISLISNKNSTATTLEQAQKDNIKEYHASFLDGLTLDSLTVKEDEYVTINGVEMYRFEGEFNCHYKFVDLDETEKTSSTQYVVGYTFIMDDIPCSLIGAVPEESKSQSNIKDIEKKIDALIKTLKSEPDGDTRLNVETDFPGEGEDSSSKYKLGFKTEPCSVPMVDDTWIELPSYPEHLFYLNSTTASFLLDVKCISITGGIAGSAMTLEQALRENMKDYKLNLLDFVPVDSLVAKESKYVTINGIDMYRFEGEFKCTFPDGKRALYAVGYTFIMDGVPCSLIGVVLDEKQSSDVIKDVEDRVDALIKTLRKEA